MNTFVSGESDARGYFSLILRLVRQPWQSAARNFGTLGIWRGSATPGWARHGWAGPGSAWNLARRGAARRGKARPGKAWNMAVRGLARLGAAWLGKEYGKARHGAARPGAARRGKELGLASQPANTKHTRNTVTTQH